MRLYKRVISLLKLETFNANLQDLLLFKLLYDKL
ncbi:hypothetical protein CLW00_11464 [Mongoliibacter ruber]|uniref:Uncharacterized protein n=1 Tax=Mongoliibacter ruber TaxID=1750599 RepID=A0A2T0WER7_9BACT|nr:hypothetical protein CLW00_11464 [Mongoliibacter ruber]